MLTLVIDGGFAGPDETLVHPSGQVEVVRVKRWLPTELDRGRYERLVIPGLKALAPSATPNRSRPRRWPLTSAPSRRSKGRRHG